MEEQVRCPYFFHQSIPAKNGKEKAGASDKKQKPDRKLGRE